MADGDYREGLGMADTQVNMGEQDRPKGLVTTSCLRNKDTEIWPSTAPNSTLGAACEDRNISMEYFSRPPSNTMRLITPITTVEPLDSLAHIKDKSRWLLALSSISCHPSDFGLRLDFRVPWQGRPFSTSPVSDISCLASRFAFAAPSPSLLHGYVAAQ
jgi:hypothetical protein